MWEGVAAAALAARALATEVGGVDQAGAFEPMAVLSGGHGSVDPVVQQPGGGVAHTELAHERQRRQARLGPADQIDGQEPSRHQQLGVFHQAAGRQRGLMSAAIALKQTPGAAASNAPLSGRFAELRMRHAGGDAGQARLRPLKWLLIEWSADQAEPCKYILSTLPEDTGSDPSSLRASLAPWSSSRAASTLLG